jgi:hypothetical protein
MINLTPYIVYATLYSKARQNKYKRKVNVVTKTEARATTRQLWFLHLLTKQDTRDWLISMKEASDMITVLKAKKIESKQRIEIPASAPVKELNAGPDPDVIVAEYTELVNDDNAITTMPVTFHYQGREVTVNQSHYLGLATQVKELDGKELPKGYGVTNMPYLRRNFMFIYIDTSWRDWSIWYANKLRNPDYQREIESQGIEVRQLCEVN